MQKNKYIIYKKIKKSNYDIYICIDNNQYNIPNMMMI